jgi:hypothetical protein
VSALLAVFLALTAVALAQGGPGAPALSASDAQLGEIALHIAGPAGAQASVSELLPSGQAIPLATVTLSAGGQADIPKAAQWQCPATVRRFSAAFSDGQTATTSIHTPSCSGRLRMTVSPRRVTAGRSSHVRVVDHWRLGGLSLRTCYRAPGARTLSCRPLKIAAGRADGQIRIRPPRPGRYVVKASAPGAGARRALIVRPRGGRLRVLAAGDSMIQIIDGDLKQRLSRIEPAKVKFDAHISTGISKPFMFDWTRHAAASAHAFHPDVSVVFLGANDGFPMSTPHGPRVNCCGSGWVKEYARRVKKMARSYRRGGAGAVYWLLLPTPRRHAFEVVFTAVNRALTDAAHASPGLIHLVDLRRVFSPDNTFRQFVRWHGHTVSARQSDGVHLSVGGAAIATDLIVRALHRDRALAR